jgi:hypothetical protein
VAASLKIPKANLIGFTNNQREKEVPGFHSAQLPQQQVLQRHPTIFDVMI